MSFSGKKFRRTRCENLQEMWRATDGNPRLINLMIHIAPVFSFIRLDHRTFIFKLVLGNRVMSNRFRLDEEFEMLRRNGTKVKITYTLEGDDVLNQVIKHPDGQITYFRREFGTSNKMIVTSQRMNRPVIIHYEQVN